MKETKIMLPALGILCLSMAASITGTVAWYKVNKAKEECSNALVVVETDKTQDTD